MEPFLPESGLKTMADYKHWRKGVNTIDAADLHRNSADMVAHAILREMRAAQTWHHIEECFDALLNVRRVSGETLAEIRRHMDKSQATTKD